MRYLRTAALLLLCAIASHAQTPASSFPRFTTSPGRSDADGFPLTGASLCLLEHKNICYQLPSHTTAPPGKTTYEFGLEPKAERLNILGGGSWVFFSGMFSGGGSGTLDRLAVLRFQPSATGGKIENLLPFVGVTNSSDRAMWNLPQISPYPVLVLADFVWGEGESHFAPHFYTVEAWTYSPRDDKYFKALSYRTSRRYEGLDSTDSIKVLNPERPEILRRLSAHPAK